MTFTYTITTQSGNSKLSLVEPYNIATVTIKSDIHLLKFRCCAIKGESEPTDPSVGTVIYEKTDVVANTDFNFSIDSVTQMTSGDGDYNFFLWGEDDTSHWNAHQLFLTSSQEIFKTKDSLYFKPIYEE